LSGYDVPMHANGVRVRSSGKLLSKFQRDRDWTVGWLSMVEENDPELHRWVRVARFHEGNNRGGAEVFPPLFDATVIAIGPSWWTLTGFERLPGAALGATVSYQQSWIIEPVGPP